MWGVRILPQVHHVRSFVAFMVRQHVSRYAAVVVLRIAQNFRHGTFSVIEVTRQSGIAGEMRSAYPFLVVGDGKFVGAFKPRHTSVCPELFPRCK